MEHICQGMFCIAVLQLITACKKACTCDGTNYLFRMSPYDVFIKETSWDASSFPSKQFHMFIGQSNYVGQQWADYKSSA